MTRKHFAFCAKSYTGVILSLLKKPVTEEDESFEDLGTETGAASDDGEIKIETF